jgi:hypothetical protein
MARANHKARLSRIEKAFEMRAAASPKHHIWLVGVPRHVDSPWIDLNPGDPHPEGLIIAFPAEAFPHLLRPDYDASIGCRTMCDSVCIVPGGPRIPLVGGWWDNDAWWNSLEDGRERPEPPPGSARVGICVPNDVPIDSGMSLAQACGITPAMLAECQNDAKDNSGMQ